MPTHFRFPAKLYFVKTGRSRTSWFMRGTTAWLLSAVNRKDKFMCGISGIVNFKATDSVDFHLLERMTSAQAHRGPDDQGYFVDGNVGLGHRRLSIIDLSGGSQPMFNEDRSVAVVFNGEIYNYAELTQNLIAQGHQFRTRSDTETIAHAYEQHGDDCVRD